MRWSVRGTIALMRQPMGDILSLLELDGSSRSSASEEVRSCARRAIAEPAKHKNRLDKSLSHRHA